jgi:hypothetical protein
MQTSYHWKPVLSREWYREAATFLWEPHFWIYLCHKEIVIDYLTSLAQHLIFFWDEWKLYQQILFCEQGLPILSGKRILRRNPKKNLTWREIHAWAKNLPRALYSLQNCRTPQREVERRLQRKARKESHDALKFKLGRLLLPPLHPREGGRRGRRSRYDTPAARASSHVLFTPP